jgi:hypothetical protein
MDPAQQNRQPSLAGGSSSPEGKRPAAEDPSVHSHVHPFPAAAAAPAAAVPEEAPPVWMARAMLVVLVAFCIEVGLVLVAVPWIPSLWHENSLLAAYPAARAFLAQDFVRGAVTGIGLVDLWLGISEAVHYRDPKR